MLNYTKCVLSCTIQVTIGKQGHLNQKEVRHVDNYDDLHEDDLVVVNCERTGERDQQPYIGKVIEISDNMVNIVWLTGAYNKPWKELMLGCGRNRRRSCDLIPIQSIMLFGFTLTTGIRKDRLHKETVQKIKELYDDLNTESE